MTQMDTFSEYDVLLPYQKRWVADDADLKNCREIPPYRFNLGGSGGCSTDGITEEGRRRARSLLYRFE